MSVREKDDPQLYAKIQEQNLLRQYDLLSNCIEIGLKKGIDCGDSDLLRSPGISESMRKQHEPLWGRMASCGRLSIGLLAMKRKLQEAD